ncbi:hypothetical protein THAOC_18204, partial [Thalassiosira oceanica]
SRRGSRGASSPSPSSRPSPGPAPPPVPLPDEPAEARHQTPQDLQAVHPDRRLEPLADRLGGAPRPGRGGAGDAPAGPDGAGEELVEAEGDDGEARLGGALAELAPEEDPPGRLEGLPHLHDELGLAAVLHRGCLVEI